MKLNFENKLTIKGEQLYLRPVKLEDANENYCRWMNDPEIVQFLECRFAPISVASLQQYISEVNKSNDTLFLAIVTHENDCHVGNIKLGPINKNHLFAEIGIIIGERNYWGKGLAAEAISLLSNYAFDVLGLQKLTAGCYDLNVGSRKAFEQNKFKVEGVRKAQYCYKGKYIDYILMGLVNLTKQISLNT